MRLYWHRRDLRPRDSPALAAAVADAPVLPVFVVDPVILDHASAVRVAGMLDALEGLRTWYRDRGSELVVARGDPEDVLLALCEAVEADGVTFEADHSGLAIERDLAVTAAVEDVGFECETVEGRLVHPPGTISPTTDAPYYSVFSYFWRSWQERSTPAPVDPPAADDLVAVTTDDGPTSADPPAIEALSATESGVELVAELNEADLPTIDDLGFDEPAASLPRVSHDRARTQLEAFCEDDIYRYAEGRDEPAADATSRLSVHFKWGTLGPREAFAATTAAGERASSEAEQKSVDAFSRQLAWREFYAHVLAYRPEIVTEDASDYREPIEWRPDSSAFEAWTAGETGYPIVDAGMRQLREEAWMHNRVRMIVASFLTKDLLIDWRSGYDWFRERLADHDTGNDVGGWQWAASTGLDAQPYFRVFNPMTQGERHDPDASYVHEYVPELADVAAEDIHRWHELGDDQRTELAPDYPAPIVDHATRREAAIELFERARGER